MLLLYLSLRSDHHSPATHLHSTMLLLYPDGKKPYWYSGRIYIPLCFYFIRRHKLISSIAEHIYIPLCFYFIHICCSFSILNLNLHSTMLLLYLRQSIASTRRIKNLHSTMLLLYPMRSRSATSIIHSFTFHYASTLSLHGSKNPWDGKSIYIPLCFYFIRHHIFGGIRNRKIYIPLCFYFIFLMR